MDVIDRTPVPAAAWPSMTTTANQDAGTGGDASLSFELYDLRVEVIAPPGAKLYCGAQPGDWFELRGEMLYLPPGQGFYVVAAGQAACSRPQRLDGLGRGSRLPGSQLPLPFPDHAPRQAPLPA
jgi:hypothetical protein